MPPCVPKRHILEVLLLSKIGRQTHGIAAGRLAGNSDGEAADFLRGLQVLFEQRRREIADRYIVESMGRIVTGKDST